MMFSIRYSNSRRLWQLRKAVLLAVLTLIGLFVVTPNAAQAATQEFTIMSVGVDVNSDKADALALDYARKRAVYLAIKKLGVADPDKAAATLKPDDVAQIIRGATVIQTKRVQDRTIAEIKVSIVELPLRHALKLPEADVPMGTADPNALRSVLVLPAVVTPKRVMVWEKENALRGPLSSELIRQAHGAVLLPGGDFADLRLIDGENVVKVKPAELKPMFERYGVDEIIIAIVKPGPVGTDEPDTVLLRRLNAVDPHDEAMSVAVEKPEDTADVRMARVAQAVASATVQIASSTAQTARQKLDAATKIQVQFIYTIPKELARMTDAIRHTPGVMLLELPAINLNNVTGTIYLNGDKTALHKALAAQGIICRDQGNQWTLSVR